MLVNVVGFILVVVRVKRFWFVGLCFWCYYGWIPIVEDSRVVVGETMTLDVLKCGLG